MMASLKDQVASTQAQLDTVEAQTISSAKVVPPVRARSYPSATMAFEDGTSFTPPTATTNTTFRPMWKTPDVAVQQNKVITTILPQASIAKGITQSPQTTSPKLTSVPNLSAVIRVSANSQVQVSWQVSASLGTSTAVASFALYRDNLQISPVAYGSSPANGAKFSVQQTFIDSPGNGLHTYSVYWATNAGTLTGDGVGRYVHALLLKPQ